ncbi:MAG: ABC transporter substrate-binding protein [Phycisphaerales bacterium]
MTLSRVLIFAALAVVLGVPFALRPETPRERDVTPADTLIVVTPHVQQIRDEFAAGFDRWHRREFGRRVKIDWRIPGGTSEIIRVLQAQFTAAVRGGQITFVGDPKSPEPVAPAGAIGFDVMLGGGSFDHGRLKQGLAMKAPLAGAGELGPLDVHLPLSVPMGYPSERLRAWFGEENRIGAQILYDPDQFWLGTALSGFGIVFNRGVLARLGLGEPDSFKDLGDPRYAGWIVLADPRQSGSIATAFESVLNAHGWDDGWWILRSMTANCRSYSNSSTKPPIEIGMGEAAAGLAIDFYGRNQAQAVGEDRVGYVDPPGEVYIDADPVSIIRCGPNPELARRFVEFCLTEEGQALWQFAPTGGDRAAGELGPERSALRRLPVRRVMYETHFDRFIDKVNPFELVGTHPSRGWRSGLLMMMGAFAVDSGDEQRAAWNAMNRAMRMPTHPDEERVQAMVTLFYSWPEVTMPDGTRLAFNEANLKAISDAWRKDKGFAARSRIEITAFFRRQYARVVEIAHEEMATRIEGP